MVSPISISITAVDKTTQVFQKLNSRIEKMQAPIVNLQRSFARFTQVSGLSRLSEGFGRVQGSALGAFRVMGQIAPILGSITGAVTIAGISRLATSWANFGSNLQTSAQRLGMSTGRLQVWQNGARLAGVSAESLTSGMQSLQDTMWNAVGGRDPKAMATFQQLHINLQNMDGSLRNVSEVIPEVADKIASIRNPSAQAAVATNFFHGAGEALLPFLRDGSAGLARYQRMAMKYGVVNDDGAEAANRLRMSQTGLTLAVEGFGNSISQALEPVLTPVIDSMANWIARNREWISQDISKYVRDFVNWLKSINWQGFSNGVTNAWGKIHDFANGVSNTVERMGGLKTVLEIVAGIMGFKIVGSILGIIGPFASLAMTVGRIVVPAMLSLVTAMGPVGWAIMAAGVIIGAASVYIYKHWDTFRPYWEKLWSAIKVTTKFSMDTLYSLISPFIKLAGKIIDNWDPIKKFFSDMFVFLRKEFDSFVGKITWMANKVSAAANKIKNAVGFGGKKKTEINSSIDQVQPMGIEQMAAVPGANAEQALASADNLKKIASQPVAAANDNISSRKKGISFPSDNSIGNIVKQVTGGDPRDVAEAKALIMTESGGRMIGNSRTSAYGYTQLTDPAAKDMGVNKYDPYQNVLGGWKYFQKMLAKTNGNMIAAYGAYHDGGNSIGVRKFINSGGVDFSGFSKEAKKAMKNFENYYNQARGGDLPFVNMPVQMPRMGSSINMGNLSSITPVTQDSGLGKLPGSGVTSMPSAPSMTMLPANASNIQDNHLYLEIDIRGKTENMDIKPKSRSNTLTIQSVSYQRAMDPGRTAGECEMRQASFRGVPFWVIGNGGENGRDIAIHNYPLKDSTWVEDLGRSQRRYDLHGFLMGNDQTSLKTMLQIAVEQEGPGLLIHPSLGILNVSVVSYKWREPDYTSNRSDIDISFIEYSNPVAGLVSSLTNSFIGELSDAFSGSAVGDFLNDTTNIFDNGMMKQAVSVASDWGAMALTQGMGSIPLAGLGTVATESIGEKLLNLAVNRDSLKDTLQMIDPSFDQNSMSTIQEKMTPNELSILIMQIPVQLMEFSDDPSVQMKLLFPLCDYHVTLVETSAPLGAAENTAMKATAALCRRAAISCLCKAASTWKADNWDEVVKVKQKISNLLNREIMSAIDDNNIDTANSLRELRIKTLEILTNAAGELPHLRTIERNTPLPALLIAQQLYADASRTEEIIRRSNPAHSAFMPVKMEVLSS